MNIKNTAVSLKHLPDFIVKPRKTAELVNKKMLREKAPKLNSFEQWSCDRATD